MDPRDSHTPGDKEWQEFSATFAPAILLTWILGEFNDITNDIAPDYFEDLEKRFSDGFANADLLQDDFPDDPQSVPVQHYADRGVTWFDRNEAQALYGQLFPHNSPEGDFRYRTWGAAVLMAFAALDAYARSLGIAIRGPIPEAIRKYAKDCPAGLVMNADVADALQDAAQTRHLLAHQRGIVNEGYVNAVANNHLHPGELRPLDFGVVMRFSGAIWAAAELLHQAHTSYRGAV